MFIQPEKKEYWALADTECKDIQYFQFVHYIVNWKRLPVSCDYIEIISNYNVIAVNFKRNGKFMWSALNTLDEDSTTSQVLHKAKAKIVDTDNGIVISFTRALDKIDFRLGLAEIIPNNEFNIDVWLNCHIGGKLTSDSELAEIINEVVLNIVQHNYRDHSEVDFSKLRDSSITRWKTGADYNGW